MAAIIDVTLPLRCLRLMLLLDITLLLRYITLHATLPPPFDAAAATLRCRYFAMPDVISADAMLFRCHYAIIERLMPLDAAFSA